MIVVTSVPHIHFKMPYVLKLGMLMGEPGERHMQAAIGAMQREIAEGIFWQGIVDHAHLCLRPQGAHATKLGRKAIMECFVIYGIVCPNGEIFIAHMYEEVDGVFAARLERELPSQGTQVEEVLVIIFVVIPSANQDGFTRDSSSRGQSVSVFGEAGTLGGIPVDGSEVCLTSLRPYRLGAFNVAFNAGSAATFGLRVAEAVWTEPPEAVEANVLVESNEGMGAHDTVGHAFDHSIVEPYVRQT